MVMCCLANSYYSMQKNNFFYKQYCRANKNYGDYRFVTIKID